MYNYCVNHASFIILLNRFPQVDPTVIPVLEIKKLKFVSSSITRAPS